MSQLTRRAYEQLIAENIEWLLQQPRTLERDHIEQIVRRSPHHEYEQNPPPERMNGSAADSSKPEPGTAPARGTETPRTDAFRRSIEDMNDAAYIDHALIHARQLEREPSSAQAQIELAFQMLELSGVPRERARFVANGIDVLVTRMSREILDANAQIAALREALKQSDAVIVSVMAAVDEVRDYIESTVSEGASADILSPLDAHMDTMKALAATRKEKGNG